MKHTESYVEEKKKLVEEILYNNVLWGGEPVVFTEDVKSIAKKHGLDV
jgi:hypothetical protein